MNETAVLVTVIVQTMKQLQHMNLPVSASEFNSAMDTEQDTRQGRSPHVCKCACVASFTSSVSFK